LEKAKVKMDQEAAPAAKRRPNAHLRELRRARIFTRLREGWPYTEIAREEGLTDRRIRQIVSETLRKRVIDASEDHALLQLARLEPALRLAAGAVADGDVKAIRYYLKLLDQLDRYRPAAAPQAYDDAARERLYAKLGQAAARLQAKAAKRALAGPPPRMQARDPTREGEAGVESEHGEGIEKIRPESGASPSKATTRGRQMLGFPSGFSWISFRIVLDFLPV
jgi:hypothetical protein